MIDWVIFNSTTFMADSSQLTQCQSQCAVSKSRPEGKQSPSSTVDSLGLVKEGVDVGSYMEASLLQPRVKYPLDLASWSIIVVR